MKDRKAMVLSVVSEREEGHGVICGLTCLVSEREDGHGVICGQ